MQFDLKQNGVHTEHLNGVEFPFEIAFAAVQLLRHYRVPSYAIILNPAAFGCLYFLVFSSNCWFFFPVCRIGLPRA